jgi:hypothetical protein
VYALVEWAFWLTWFGSAGDSEFILGACLMSQPVLYELLADKNILSIVLSVLDASDLLAGCSMSRHILLSS